MPATANRRLARHVAAYETVSVAERRELLDMLGLLGPPDDDGRPTIAPDDERFNDLSKFGGGGEPAAGTSASRRMAHYQDPPDRPGRFTSPPGLRSYAERAAAEEAAAAAAEKLAAKPVKAKPVRAPRPRPLAAIRLPHNRGEGRPVAVCGTLGGRRKHKRLGEEVCGDCKLAYNAWQRDRNHRKKGDNWVPKRPAAECGTPAGRKKHYREKTQVCEPCLAAAREDGRRMYHAAQAKKRALRDEQQAS